MAAGKQLPREYRNVFVLVIAQAIVGAQMPIAITIMGLAGQKLASNPCWATLPISVMVFGSMTTAPWLGKVMQRFGRKIGFWCGCLGGLAGGIIGFCALYIASFELFLVGAYFTGIYMSTNGFSQVCSSRYCQSGIPTKGSFLCLGRRTFCCNHWATTGEDYVRCWTTTIYGNLYSGHGCKPVGFYNLYLP